MAFPGDRKYKLTITIGADLIAGTPSHDGLLCITHASLPDEMLTLGGTYGLQDGAVDLAASSDALGTTQIPLYVYRGDIEETPANSRLEVWIRRQDVSAESDTDITLWWGSETETAPAADANYGRNDVFDGTTGTGTPLPAWAVWLFGEDPADPAPCYTDVSGNDHHANDIGDITRIDMVPGRGQSHAADGSTITVYGTHTWAPGTGDFAIAFVAAHAGSTCRTQVFGQLDMAGGGSDYVVDTYSVANPGSYTAETPYLVMATRDGDNCTLTTGNTESTATGWSTFDATDSSISLTTDWLAHRLSFGACFDGAPNAYWRRMLSDCLTNEAGFWTVGDVELAAITAYLTFAPLATGSEVRVYEEPHPQTWTVDFTGITAASLSGDYIGFGVQGSSDALWHEAWFDLDNGSSAPHSATAWAGSTAYSVGDYVTNDTDHLYVCTTAGTSAASGGPTGTGTGITDGGCEWDYAATYHWVDVTTGWTATQIAGAFATVLDAITDLSAWNTGAVASVANANDGEMADPADGATTAAITVTAIGGTATTEIDGIEDSTGSSWQAEYTVLRPRKATYVIIRPGYEPIRGESYTLTVAGGIVPTGQRVDLNYLND